MGLCVGAEQGGEKGAPRRRKRVQQRVGIVAAEDEKSQIVAIRVSQLSLSLSVEQVCCCSLKT